MWFHIGHKFLIRIFRSKHIEGEAPSVVEQNRAKDWNWNKKYPSFLQTPPWHCTECKVTNLYLEICGMKRSQGFRMSAWENLYHSHVRKSLPWKERKLFYYNMIHNCPSYNFRTRGSPMNWTFLKLETKWRIDHECFGQNEIENNITSKRNINKSAFSSANK